MLRITHTRGRRAPTVERFDLARVRIGTAPGSEIAFAPGLDPGVAPHHAEIRFHDGAYHVVDLGTPAGTFVNRAPVRTAVVRAGDLIAFGGHAGPELRIDFDDADGRVDLETAQRIVHAAVAHATSGGDRATAMVAARVSAAQRSASRQQTLLSLGVLVAFVALGGAALAVFRSDRAAGALATETGIGNAPVQRPAGEIPTRVYTGREIYESNRSALYVIGYLLGNTVGGCCTAFAIKPNVLATNAHCVFAFREKGGTPIVTQNDSGGKVRFKIVAAQIHPSYKRENPSADTPDVGLLRIDGTMPKTVTIGSDAELRAVGPGDDVFVLGFPGRVMDPISPSATFLQGHIGRTFGLDQQQTSPEKSVMLQHDAVTRGGNSGSPIFNQYGHVIAVHAAHLDEEEDVQVGGKKTTVVDASSFRIGMRIDLIKGVPAP